MSLTNIKLNSQAQRGFTIVELLIVVVVIAILAAITIVSYNGITNNAKKSAAQAAATTFAKKAELYQANKGNYPLALTDLQVAGDSGEAWYLPSATGITYNATPLAPPAPTDPNTIRVAKCSATSITQANIDTAAEITGMRIFWWDYSAGAVQQTNIGNTAFCEA